MKSRPGVPPRPFIVLCALVLVAHGLALREAPATLAWRARGAEPPASPVPAAPAVRVIASPAPVQPPAEIRPRERHQQRSPGPAASQAPPADADAKASEAASTPPHAPAPAVAVPGPARWHYDVTALHRGTLASGRAELAWWHDGERYEATLRVDVPPLGPRVQRSTGTLDPRGLAPIRFSERVRGEEAAHFERDAARIVFSANVPAAPLRAGAQDRLSVLLQFAALLRARPHPGSSGDAIVVQTATTREAQEWRFTVEGTETLVLPGGPADALKLVRGPQREWEPRLELWYVPGADYGPVRLRLTPATGDWLEMQWSGTDKG